MTLVASHETGREVRGGNYQLTVGLVPLASN